jgi:hypothetical protein
MVGDIGTGLQEQLSVFFVTKNIAIFDRDGQLVSNGLEFTVEKAIRRNAIGLGAHLRSQGKLSIARRRIASCENRHSSRHQESAHHLSFRGVPEPIAEFFVEGVFLADRNGRRRIAKPEEDLFMVVDGPNRLEYCAFSKGCLHRSPRRGRGLVQSLIAFPDTHQPRERSQIFHDRLIGHRFTPLFLVLSVSQSDVQRDSRHTRPR